MGAANSVLKFPRYDKNQLDNPGSLGGELREVLNGNSNGFYQVTSVEVDSAAGEEFTGTAGIRVKCQN